MAPTLIVIPASFSSAASFQFPPRQWSLRWYERFFTSPEWLSALYNSVELGLVVAVIATAAGTAAALGLARIEPGRRRVWNSFISAPMVAPGIVVAVAVYAVFLRWGLTGSFLGFVAAHTMLAIPLVVMTVTASLSNYDESLELASASLGASWITTTRRITIPLLAPGVLSGFVFAFVTSFDEVVMALFLQAPDLKTLPVQMYNAIALDIDPTISAASSIVVVFTTLLLLVPQFFTKSKGKLR
jgi:putative spermidine/putrescine transport system permease protein